ncbi:hypothetical protein HPB50_019385 [Hyalomma asiaticum]|uniref:Uncharacterized protein n=1 Tax=Hyalomma asiaticum TaxID=266040 RepID=A0ACB7RRW0_HYAAI|nr:hypothetical protein HPB50_019385 [Hyalomma asiaticum]
MDGDSRGSEGKALLQGVEKERERESEEYALRREAAKEDHERKLERQAGERQLLELRLRMQELQQTSQALPAELSDRDASRQGFRSPHKLMPAFNEARDELDAYSEKFERVAADQGWPRDRWGLSLSLCLTGEALTVVGRMSAEDATDFARLKSTLLQRYRYTEEGCRVKFRESKPENGDTGRQFVGRLLGYFDHWQEMAKTERTYDGLRDRVVSEQFLLQCDGKLAIFLKERGCEDLNSLAETADHYLEAQGLTSLAKGQLESADTKSGTSATEPSSAQGNPTASYAISEDTSHQTACLGLREVATHMAKILLTLIMAEILRLYQDTVVKKRQSSQLP